MNELTALGDTEAADKSIRTVELIGAILLLTCAILAAVGGLTKLYLLTAAAMTVLGVFLVWEISRVPVQQLITAGVLFVLGCLAALPSNGFLDVLLQAFEGSLIFVALFVGIAFLQYPALNSPSFHATREFIIGQPAGRRYLILSVSAHLLGALTNFSALGLLTTFLHGKLEKKARQRMACAMMRGFGLTAIWSPFFISIAVILHVKPELKWLDIAIPGFPLAMLMLIYSWAYDRLSSFLAASAHARANAASVNTTPKLSGQVITKIAFLAFALVLLLLMSSEVLEISIPIAVILVIPAFSIGWQLLLVRTGADGNMSRMLPRVADEIAKLRAQVFIFLAANYLGYGAARVIDPDLISSTLLSAGIEGWAAIYVLLATMLICTLLMFHPLALVVLVGQVFPGEYLGVHNVSVALCMALVWAVGTNSSPASGLTLFMMRVLDESPWRIAWGWNGVYAIGGFIVGGLYISLVNKWLL